VLALTFGTFDTGSGALGYPKPFLLSDPSRNSQHQLSGRSGGPKVSFGVRLESHTVDGELSNVLKRLKHALSGQPIQRPHQHNIEAALRGILEHPPECFPISSFAGYVVFVHLNPVPSLSVCIFA
jgi:hypothetical protein